MMGDYLARAIQLLRPNSEFSYIDNDYSTIKWDVLDGDAPTQSEIDEAIEQIKLNDVTQVQVKAQAKAIAEGKLAALGLTTDDLRALGL
jgi:hypothetical protein